MYSTWNVEALKAKLRERGASLKGRKADLIERLEAYDRNQNFDAVQAEENDDPKMVLPDNDAYLDINSSMKLPPITKEHITLYFLQKCRLTASIFHTICHMKETTKNGYAMQILEKENILSRAIMHGIINEKVALKQYIDLYELDVTESGVHISEERPYLAASPDGSALTDVPIEDRSSQPTIQVPSATAFESTLGPSTSALPVSSAAIQPHEAVANLNVEPAISVPAVSSATLQKAVPNTSVDVGNISDVLKVLSPLPDASKKRLTARRTQRSETLTSSPYKKQLI
ncbi:hypothetical protein EVAR_10297_1 [Eumeta japonica]|uniref:SAP domain-containing protein n=1 Tax=Eumeta variegata TaxID=151549 RepID=A0A4C1TEL3_EUMVA|nr:hypothetical protein EVAR_10297_1 [Eumeta japonica]